VGGVARGEARGGDSDGEGELLLKGRYSQRVRGLWNGKTISAFKVDKVLKGGRGGLERGLGEKKKNEGT